MTAQPQIEPVTDEDTRVATQSYFINIKRILEQDRRRVAERRANHGTTHAEGCVSWGRGHYECAIVEIERLRAEVARLNEERADCEPFLKEGERLDECLERRRADSAAVFDLLIQEKKKSEALEAQVARLTAALNGKENSDA